MSRPKPLAESLARAAAHVDAPAGQMLAYMLFLWRVDPLSRVHEAIEQFDPDIVAQIDALLDNSDIDALCAYYTSRGLDPAIAFFEEFGRACDPASSRRRGVHYTPPAVVSYMVRAVEFLLRSRLQCPLWQSVLLDPCCGIGTFPRFVAGYSNPCPKMIGMELMPMARQIARALVPQCQVLLVDGLSDYPIDTHGNPLLVLGNPPYSGHSANVGAIAELMEDYSTGLNERNPKWLQDDYVKFVRMAQHRVAQAGRGIVALITNHSFVYSPTFRAMRASLSSAFDEIYVLDLHGDARRNDEPSRSEPDENIFSIQAGVAVSFMVRASESPSGHISYAELRGTRDSKLKRLSGMGFEETPWRSVSPTPPFGLFIPHTGGSHLEYAGFASLFDIFETSRVGFVTSRDSFAVDFDRRALLERIALVRDGNVSDDEIRERYEVGDLDIEAARRSLRSDPNWQDKAVEVLYRPFDRRWAYLSATVMERPRLAFMQNLLRPNVALAVGRAGRATGSLEWDVVFCTDTPTDLNVFRRGGAMLFPRYVYPGGVRRSNMVTDNDDLHFGYVYAILHSTAYRKRYSDALQVDYPRIPRPPSDQYLGVMAAFGDELMSVHLMRDQGLRRGSCADVTLRIGGYELPGKLLEDRTRCDCPDPALTDRVKTALARTVEIRASIDRLVESQPPW